MESDKTDKKKQMRRGPASSAKPSEALLAAKRKMRERNAQDRSGDGIVVKDDYAVAQNAKKMVKGKTGIVFDDVMEQHYCLWDANYPECPARYTSVMNRSV